MAIARTAVAAVRDGNDGDMLAVGWWWRNGQWVGSVIMMCCVVIAMDDGCRNGQRRCGGKGKWLRDSNVMGDGNLAV